MTDADRRISIGLLALALFWLGLLIGVSFLATSVKFLAPSLSLPVALDVGRYTFAFLNPLELLLAVLLAVTVLVAFRRSRKDRGTLAMAALLLLLVLCQSLWLLPVLDARVEIILQGATPPASSLHRVYIAVDVLKLVLLSGVACRQIRPVLA